MKRTNVFLGEKDLDNIALICKRYGLSGRGAAIRFALNHAASDSALVGVKPRVPRGIQEALNSGDGTYKP